MTSRIQNAVADAMTRLKTSDVSGATAVIRNALIGRDSPPPTQRATTALLGGQTGRRLGDVLKLLKTRRTGLLIPTAPPRTQPSPDNPRFTSHSLTTGAGSLNYKLYVPEDRDRELALVLMLHGCTQDPDDFARGTRMNRLADELGLVVAYPHQATFSQRPGVLELVRSPPPIRRIRRTREAGSTGEGASGGVRHRPGARLRRRTVRRGGDGGHPG